MPPRIKRIKRLPLKEKPEVSEEETEERKSPEEDLDETKRGEQIERKTMDPDGNPSPSLVDS